MNGAYLYELLFWFLIAVLVGATVAFLVPRRGWLIASVALLTALIWILLGGGITQRAVYALILLWYLGGWSLGVLLGSRGRRRWSLRNH